MRVLLSSWGSRGDVEPLMAFALRLRELGAEVRVCVPPDFADLVARVDVPLIPMGKSLRELLGAKPPAVYSVRKATDTGGRAPDGGQSRRNAIRHGRSRGGWM